MKRTVEFEPQTLPWLDRYQAEIDTYVDSLGDRNPVDYDLRWMLRHWMQFGYAVFPQAIDHATIDAYLGDIDELIATRDKYGVRMNAAGQGVKHINEMPQSVFDGRHYRLMDVHNASVAGKKLALAPTVASFLQHVFRATPVAMQTLTFLHGSEQGTHQDFPYVVSGVASHLAASWIALEDVHPDAGPLGYYPGSHTIRKFDWEDGLVWTESVKRSVQSFKEHLDDECARSGLELKTFCAKKGDVFVWHAALAHCGMPVNNPALTRKSLVTHFSTQQAYQFDRRAPREKPTVFALNGGLVYADATLLHEENVFQRGGAAPAILK